MTEAGGEWASSDAFLSLLLHGRPGLDVWLHSDEDGTPWTCVSHDFTVAGGIRDTLRLDFDGGCLLGRWSPAKPQLGRRRSGDGSWG